MFLLLVAQSSQASRDDPILTSLIEKAKATKAKAIKLGLPGYIFPQVGLQGYIFSPAYESTLHNMPALQRALETGIANLEEKIKEEEASYGHCREWFEMGAKVYVLRNFFPPYERMEGEIIARPYNFYIIAGGFY